MKMIKICGITNLEDALSAQGFGATALGFVFSESKRRIDPDSAKKIIDSIKRDHIMIVGVFVNETTEKVKEIQGYCKLDAIQLHGDESSEFCGLFEDIKTIKAFRMRDESVLNEMALYKDLFAYLLDAYSDEAYGGTGKSFNWDLAIKAKSIGRPIILSGGIGLDNAKDAIKRVLPYGLDISSSIEIRPGKKDPEKMRELINLIKNLD